MTYTKLHYWFLLPVIIILLYVLAPGVLAAGLLDELNGVITAYTGVLSPAANFGVLIDNIIFFLGALLLSLSALMILLGGILYMLSAGDESKAAQAKKIITYAIVGFFVSMAATIIASTVRALYLAATPAAAAAAASPLIAKIVIITQFLWYIGFPLAITALVIGGITYILSAGNDKRTSTAKNIIVFSILGLIVILAAETISFIVQYLYVGDVGSAVGLAAPLIQNVGTFGASIVAILSTVAILFGGIMYILSAGDEQRAAQAKKIIIFAIIGLVIAASASVIVGLARDVYGDPLGPGLGATPLLALIGNISILILSPLALTATAAIIYGGYMYVTSAGEEDKARRGKQIILYAFIGIVIILISASVVNIVITIGGRSGFTPPRR